MRQPLKLFLAFALFLTWTVGADAAFADKIVSGYIVRIEAKEIYFNISTRDGLNRGSSLRIKRPIKLRHPVSGKQITDWLPIGVVSTWRTRVRSPRTAPGTPSSTR